MPSESFSKSEIAEITANENEAFNNRTFFGTAKDNLTNKTKDKLKFQFALSSRGYVTFALFLLGLLVGRSGFFEKVSIRRKKNIILLAGFFIASVVIEVIGKIITPSEPINLLMHISLGHLVPLSSIVTSTLNDLGSLTESAYW